MFEKIESTADTLNQLVTFLTEERSKGDQAVKDMLLSNHPLFIALRKTMKIPYPIFFKNLGEMEALLNARKTNPISKKEWDTPDYREYLSEWFKSKKILKIFERLFEKDGKLKIITPDDWKDEYVSLEDMPKPTEDEDDIPF